MPSPRGHLPRRARLLAGATGTADAEAATPGEITDFEIGSPCFEAPLAAAPAEGVLVRQCESSGTSERAPIDNLLPSGRLVGLAAVESPAGPLVAGPNGEVWVATNAGGYSKDAVGVARIAPDGSVLLYPLSKQSTGPETKPEVRGMVIGREGALWAAVGYDGTTNPEWYSSIGGELVRITADGTMTEFQTPVGIEPEGIALGAEGDLWFTAISGLSATEHTFQAATGHIGRMTTGGEVEIFPTPNSHSSPGPIAAAPDGTLWFGEAGPGNLGTISAEGNFGPRRNSPGGSPASLAFGPEGDLWAGGSSLIRMTPAGQRTDFGVGAAHVVVGPEGNIWAQGFEHIWRVVPGAPGLDLWSLTADRKSRTATVALACGGSSSACRGTLEITLPKVTKRPGQKPREWKHSTYVVMRRGYHVPTESSVTVRFRLAPPALAIAAAYGHEHRGASPTATVTATVAGGPTMKRKVELRPPPAKPRAG